MYANENISEEEEEEEDAQLMSAELADNSKDTAKVHRFDRRLPVTHSYLGDVNQGELSAEALFEEPGEQIKVPVLVMHEVCLLPGQKMPLQFYMQPSIQFLADTQRQRRYFALFTSAEEDTEPQNAEDFSAVPCHPVGTLFQIQNILMNRDDRVTIQVVGRQRCRLMAPLQRHHIHCGDISVLICDQILVLVLDEHTLPVSIFPRAECCSFNRLSREEAFKYRAALSPHSKHTLQQCSTDGVVARLTKFKKRQIDLVIQQGLTMFSFWAAANIPMSLDKKLELLSEDSTDKRLRIEWRIVARMDSMVCVQCDNAICSVSDIINLSVDSNSTHFVNPGGFVHDLFTVRKVKGIVLQGEPSAEFSWFPGYLWTVMVCASCGTHLGWGFGSTRLIPGHFYGISRRSFQLACSSGEEEPI